jgi:hypothetical protein
LRPTEDEGTAGVFEYNRRVVNDPRLVSLALPLDDEYTDGFTIAVVKQ